MPLKPEARIKLIAYLVSLVRMKIAEDVRRDRLASQAFMYATIACDSTMGTEESTWVNDIWVEVRKQTGAPSWSDMMASHKMPSQRKH